MSFGEKIQITIYGRVRKENNSNCSKRLHHPCKNASYGTDRGQVITMIRKMIDNPAFTVADNVVGAIYEEEKFMTSEENELYSFIFRSSRRISAPSPKNY